MLSIRATGVSLALLLLTASLSAQTWSVPRSPADVDPVRMDAHGHRARGVMDARLTPPPAGSERALGAGWVPLGPFGGDADDVASSPTTAGVVLAGFAPNGGSGGTLWRSTDGAATWSEVAALSGTSVHDIEFDSTGKAYLGTIDSVWTSTDDGANWTQQSLGIGLNDQVYELTIDPNDESRIWIGVADALGGQTVNVMLSTNGGVSWTDETPAAAVGTSCRGIALDPTDSNKVFASFGGGFGGGALFVTVNGGTTWVNRSAGLPANPLNDVEHDGTRALVTGGQLFGSQDVGLFESTDDGLSWNPLHEGSWPVLAFNDLELDPADASILYLASLGGGIYRSDDGGSSWTLGYGGTDGFSLNEVHVDASGGAPIFVGGSSIGIWKSADGLTFSGASVGIGSLHIESVTTNPNDHDELAVAFQGLNNGGVYSSTDAGATWSIAALPGTRYNTVLFAPDGTLYAISDGPTTIAEEGLYRRDAPGTWTPLGPDQGSAFESELYGLAFSAIDPNLIVTTGADFGVAGFEPTVWVSDDAGASWSKTHEGLVDYETVRNVVILADGSDQNMVAAYTDFGASQDGGALRSTDGGASWSTANTGLNAGAQCYDLDVSHFDSATVYLADDDSPNGAVYRSIDGGASWTGMGFSGRARLLVTDPLRPLRLYITSYVGATVKISDDGGASFSPFDTGLGGAGWLYDLELAPGACNQLLVASATGVYSEAEGGCSLETDADTLSLSAGGAVTLNVAAGQAHASLLYIVLGSASGTSGIPIPPITLPLTWDVFTNQTLNRANSARFVNTLGVLDADGMATGWIVLPPGSDPGLAGTELWFAHGVFTLPLQTYYASNAIKLTLVP